MFRRDRLLRKMLRKRYLVTLVAGESFDGVLFDIDETHLVLADAEHVDQAGERARVDGHLWIPRVGVIYMQTINP